MEVAATCKSTNKTAGCQGINDSSYKNGSCRSCQTLAVLSEKGNTGLNAVTRICLSVCAGLAGESSSDSSDEDDDDDDDDEEDSEGGEETCPPGCDPILYDKVSEHRIAVSDCALLPVLYEQVLMWI